MEAADDDSLDTVGHGMGVTLAAGGAADIASVH